MDSHRLSNQGSAAASPGLSKWNIFKIKGLLSRHLQAFWYVLTVILPLICRSGKRPVIFDKYSGIGDIICTFPTALELKKRHPQSEFLYNCYEDYSCLPKLGGITDHITNFIYIGLIGHWYRFLLSGYYQFSSDDDDPTAVHREIYIKDFGRKFGVPLDGNHPRIHPDPKSLSRVDELLRKFPSFPGPRIIIHPGPTWPVREWPQEHWVSLVDELRRHGLTNIIQLGVGKTLRFGATEIAVTPNVISLVNQLTLEESIALISTADLLVGLDSGLLHIAAALQIPAIGLWGCTSPHLRFSKSSTQFPIVSQVECQGCHHRIPRLHWFSGCPYDIKCMKSIQVDEVWQAVLNHIEKSPVVGNPLSN